MLRFLPTVLCKGTHVTFCHFCNMKHLSCLFSPYCDPQHFPLRSLPWFLNRVIYYQSTDSTPGQQDTHTHTQEGGGGRENTFHPEATENPTWGKNTHLSGLSASAPSFAELHLTENGVSPQTLLTHPWPQSVTHRIFSVREIWLTPFPLLFTSLFSFPPFPSLPGQLPFPSVHSSSESESDQHGATAQLWNR